MRLIYCPSYKMMRIIYYPSLKSHLTPYTTTHQFITKQHHNMSPIVAVPQSINKSAIKELLSCNNVYLRNTISKLYLHGRYKNHIIIWWACINNMQCKNWADIFHAILWWWAQRREENAEDIHTSRQSHLTWVYYFVISWIWKINNIYYMIYCKL